MESSDIGLCRRMAKSLLEAKAYQKSLSLTTESLCEGNDIVLDIYEEKSYV